MRIRHLPRRTGQAGFTLVEMMIAMAIGLFMTAIIASLYLNMRSSFRYQEDFARLQENGRFAMEAITRDIRMAGYRGCVLSDELVNVVNGGTTNPFLNLGLPVLGYEGGSLPTVLTAAGALNTGPDAIILIGVDASSELLVQSHVPASAQINTSTHSIAAGEILLITDCKHSTIFQMTGPNSATKTNVVHNTGSGTPGNCTKYFDGGCANPKSYKYEPGASLMRVYSNAYFIAPSSTGSGRSLYALRLIGQTSGSPVKSELITGVEDMQVTYGLDTGADYSADRYSKASSMSATDWEQVVSVRVSLLVASRDDNLSSGRQTYDFNGATVTATDRKVRKAFTATTTVRNRTK